MKMTYAIYGCAVTVLLAQIAAPVYKSDPTFGIVLYTLAGMSLAAQLISCIRMVFFDE